MDKAMRDRTGWIRCDPGPVRVGKKLYNHLVEFKRACGTCGDFFSVHVTAKIADGHSDSNSFGLRNCPKHRRNAVANPLSDETVMANNVMREELDGCYAMIADLKARLAQYELAPAMAAQAALTNKMPWE